MKKSTMTARKLRILLSIVLILTFVGATAGFLYIRKSMLEYANTISRLNADAASGDKNLQVLREVEAKLDAEKQTAEAAKSVLADSAHYTETIVSQLSAISKASNVSINSIEFAASAATTDGAQVTPATPGAAAPAAPSAAAAGLRTESVTVTITSPLPYDRFMDFLRRIETSSLQMQVDNVSLTTDATGSVSTPPLAIKVFVK